MSIKQTKYSAPTASKIHIESSALLTLLRHTSENYPSLYSGTLLGFESDEGKIDITHAYPYPYPDQYEGGSLRSRNGGKYQQDILESLKKLGYGIEFQGWFQSTTSGNFVTNQLVDTLVQQQLANANTFILIHNMASVGKEVDVKGYRLTENFVTTYLDGKWKSKDLEAHKLSYFNIFEEVELQIDNQYLVSTYIAGLPTIAQSETEYDVLKLTSNQNVTAQLLESLYGQIDSYNYDQNNFNYYQRHLQKEHAKISQWKSQRKLENIERSRAGEKELDPNEWKTLFKLPVEPSRYNNLLHSHAIDVLADDILKKCDEELTKSSAIERKLVGDV
ncbi:hypothetical protein QA089_001380 [Meyerozyma guilliermondii]